MDHDTQIPRTSWCGGQAANASANPSSGLRAGDGSWADFIPRNWEEALAVIAVRAGALWAGPVPRSHLVTQTTTALAPSRRAPGSGQSKQRALHHPGEQREPPRELGNTLRVGTTGTRQRQGAPRHKHVQGGRLNDNDMSAPAKAAKRIRADDSTAFALKKRGRQEKVIQPDERSIPGAAIQAKESTPYRQESPNPTTGGRLVSQPSSRMPVYPTCNSQPGWQKQAQQSPGRSLFIQQRRLGHGFPCSAFVNSVPSSTPAPTAPETKLYGHTEFFNSSSKRNEGKETKLNARASSLRAAAAPLPMGYGQNHLNKKAEFQFPANSVVEAPPLLESNPEPPIERYQKIRTNVFVEGKPRRSKDVSICQCVRPKNGGPGCTENCINRLTYYECSVKHCPCGLQCSNRRFQTRLQVESLEVFWTKTRGHGLRTLVPIPKGSLVIEYLGEVISIQECRRRMETTYAKNKNHYFLGYGQGKVLDSAVKGNEARFVNHSCDPNCHIEKWFVQDGEIRVGLFASRDIRADEEIFYDYNFETFPGATRQQCRCGSASCRGVIGRRREEPKVVQSAPTNEGCSAGQRSSGNRKATVVGQWTNVAAGVSKFRRTMPTLGERRRQGAQGKWVLKNAEFLREHRTFLIRNVRAVDKDYVPVRARESGISIAAAMEQFKQRWTVVPKRKYTRKSVPLDDQPAVKDTGDGSAAL